MAAAVAALLWSAQARPAEASRSGPVQSYDSYGSWFVACDNTLACVAKGFADSSRGTEIRIERDAGPAAKPVLSIRADHKFVRAGITIDGKPAGLAAPVWEMTTDDDETALASDDLAAIRAFVLRLRDSSTLRLTAEDDIPLDGFAAAMLRLDSRQGRVGGVTALLRPGPLPAAKVPPPPAPPKIPYRPITARLAPGEDARLIAAVRAGQKAVFAKEDCEADVSIEPVAYPLDTRQALVLIPCIMGAYQGSSLAFVAPRAGGVSQRLIAPTPYLGNASDHAGWRYFTDSTFDPKTGMLSDTAKGRAMADCGMSANWIWDGAVFRLADMALQKSCGGIEAGDWPVLFRSTR
ncbi:hypothetical protein AWL63_21945 [Sphingomonas panacis]|uniref:DUF1176 domain-containing protein n=2 Tax=Sphingomonas panacis TaxID=1560345 RepID=A0A1B3ZFL9_9SPHN|nr:hypothetical protein AWL63_21945 [Sphingomonas panacis]